jgi:hypothetical protein
MLSLLDPEAPSPTPREIARSFRWLGWLGFWLQALFGFIPTLVVVTAAMFGPARQQVFSFGLWLAIACLAILLFSIYWSFRYTQLATQLENPDLRPAKSQVFRDLKIGLLANISTMIIALAIALSRVGELTFKLLTLPQSATVVSPNQVGTTLSAPGALITPSNMITIQAMIHAIAAGLAGVIVTLLLIYQLGQHRSPKA